jgi:hypothetical protein
MKTETMPAAPGARTAETNLNLGTVAEIDDVSRPRLLIERRTGRLFKASSKRPLREIGVRESVLEMARIQRASERHCRIVSADDGMIRWLDRVAEALVAPPSADSHAPRTAPKPKPSPTQGDARQERTGGIPFFAQLALVDSTVQQFVATFPDKGLPPKLRSHFRNWSVPGLRWLWANGDANSRACIAARVAVWRDKGAEGVAAVQARVMGRESARLAGGAL